MDTAQENPLKRFFFVKFILEYLIPPIIVFLIGFGALIGWLLNIESFKQMFLFSSSMNPLTAISFVLSSIVFAILIKRNTKYGRLVSIFLIGIVLTISSFKIIEILFGFSLGIDLIFFKNSIESSDVPARMSFITAMNFLIINTSYLLFLARNDRITNLIIQFFAAIVFSISALVLGVYLTGTSTFLHEAIFFSLAINTSIAFIPLSVGLFFLIRIKSKRKVIFSNTLIMAFSIAALIPIWIFYISSETLKFSSGFKYSVNLVSTDNYYDKDKGIFLKRGFLETPLDYSIKKIDKDKTEIENTFNVKTVSGEEISSNSRTFNLSRFSRQHTELIEDKKIEGYIFGPPNADKNNFNFFTVLHDGYAEMEFREEENILGLKTYRYESEFTVDKTESFSDLSDVGEIFGIKSEVKITLWIEPITGHLIKYEDNEEAYYYDIGTGENTELWSKFSNKFDQISISQQAKIAEVHIQQVFFIKTVVPLALVSILVMLSVMILLNKFRKFKNPIYLPLTIFTIILATTFLVWGIVKDGLDRQLRSKFEEDITTIENLIIDRLSIYSELLEGGRGLLEASESVTKDEWKAYIESLHLDLHHLSLQKMGYIEFESSEELGEAIQSQYVGGISGFVIIPEGKKEIYLPIKYLEPLEEGEEIISGLELAYDPAKYRNLDWNVDTESASIFEGLIVTLETGEDDVNEFLLFVPTFLGSEHLEEHGIEHTDVGGYVFGYFKIDDFVRDVFENTNYDIDVRIYSALDSDSINSKSVLNGFDSEPEFMSTRGINLFGDQWVVRYSSFPGYGSSISQNIIPTIILFAGISVGTLIFVIMYLVVKSRIHAERLAMSMTEELESKSVDLESINETLSKEVEKKKKSEATLINKTNELERINKIMVGREIKMAELKKEARILKPSKSKIKKE